MCYLLYAIHQDGYTAEVMGPEGVHVLVATRAKSNRNISSPLDREFYVGFLDVRLFSSALSFDIAVTLFLKVLTIS